MTDLHTRTRFEPSDVEPRIVERWLEAGLHHPEPAGTPDENFSIAVPPPNVTGALHMGHALNGTIQDALIRTHRMRGQRTKWILGTDHAGIATQRQVEKRLEAQGTTREALGREAFSEAVWSWREEFGGQIIEQFKRLGAHARLRRRALHDRRGLRPRGAEGLRRPLRAGPHLPRQLHGQLGPGPALGDLRPRGGGPRGRRRHAVLDRLSAGRRQRRGGGRDGAPGDDAGRHGGRGAPGRRALPRPRRARRRAAARRAAPADHRRRLREDRLRHRLPEDHARPRSQRLRDRPRGTGWRRSPSSARTAA